MPVFRNFRWPVYVLVLFAGYSVLLPARERVLPDGVLTIFQAHRVKAEDFLLRDDVPHAILIGSSLSAVLPDDALRGVYNLALSGGSASTGLRLIAAKNKCPQVLFVEVNMLTRLADEGLLAEVLNPTALGLKRWCAACLTRNQPLTVGLSYLSWWRLKESNALESAGATLGVARAVAHSEILLAANLKSASKPVTASAMDHLFRDLIPRLERLREAGTRIVFVDMPLHPRIADADYNQATLAAVLARCPPSTWEWIRFQDRAYSTNDGMHLQYPDATTVARTIVAQGHYLNGTVYP